MHRTCIATVVYAHKEGCAVKIRGKPACHLKAQTKAPTTVTQWLPRKHIQQHRYQAQAHVLNQMECAAMPCRHSASGTESISMAQHGRRGCSWLTRGDVRIHTPAAGGSLAATNAEVQSQMEQLGMSLQSTSTLLMPFWLASAFT